MSNARKLQTEIDRVMKKVDEGVELFDEIWEKVYSAEQQNQKEKYEMDLKKEIKKLQRLRDQIKTWIGSSDVKDKEPLIEARKLIETKMEQFKICEKETKTKTYSKEGLAREEKLDPAEEAKLNTTSWVGEYIEKLQGMVEEKDFEIEKLSSGKGKKTNKHQIEELQEHITNHKYHINKLEGIIRLVNNDRLDAAQVDTIKDDLDYYLESYADDDYMQAYDEEFFYESLKLEELDVVNVDRVTHVSTSSKKSTDDAASSSSRGSREKRSTKKSSLSMVIPLTIGRARASSSSVKSDKDAGQGSGVAASAGVASGKRDNEEKQTPSKLGSRSNSTASSKSDGPAPSAARVPSVAPSSQPQQQPAASSAQATVPQPQAASSATAGIGHGQASMAAILKRESEQQEKEKQQQLQQQQKATAAEQLRQQQAQEAQARQQQQEALRQQQEQQAAAAAAAAQQEALKRQQQQQQEALRQQQALQQQQQEAAAKQQALQKQQQAQLQAQQQAAAAAAAEQKAQKMQKQQQPQQQQHMPPAQTNAMDILTSGLGGLGIGAARANDAAGGIQLGGGAGVPSSAAAAPSGTAGGGAMEGAGSSYLSALNESFATVPTALDNERSRQYTPQNPYPTPASYPGTPSTIFDNPAVFEKLGTDCLFFIFYYAQGTYQQYLAARELKKQSWRFHKKYMTWFQRHEEPKITTDEYEQGTYVYFDYETGWCTRIKTDFRFEYSFLEDSLQ